MLAIALADVIVDDPMQAPEPAPDDPASPDPLVACIGEVAARLGVPFASGMLSSLALGADGSLPYHQAAPALDLLGLQAEEGTPRRLPRRGERYPAIVALTGEDAFAVVHEVREGEALVWRPSRQDARWENLRALDPAYRSWLCAVFGNPTTLRDASQPWHLKAREHWFWSEVRRLRRRFAPVLVATLLINLLALALPLFSMNVYDRVIPNRAASSLWVLAIGVLVAFAFDYALRRARTQVLEELGRELDLRLSQKIFARLLSAPLTERKGATGNLAARVTEYAHVRDFFASTTVVLMVDLMFLALFVATITWLAGWLAMVPLVAIGIMAAAGFRLQRKAVQAAREAQADHGLQQTLLVESIAGIETLKSLAGEGAMIGRWRRLAELGTQSQQRMRDINSTAIGLAGSFQQVSNIALIVGGYYLFDAGKITMGAIIAIVMLSSRSLAPAAQLAYLLARGQQARETLASIQRLWDAGDERRMGSASVMPQVRSGHIRLDGASFTYPEASLPSLDSLNLTIEPGERIAVIGRVASGKSTLGRMLCGLYQPTGGAMLVDGIDSRQFRPAELRAAFRFIAQDSDLFTGTIKDNLALGAGMARDRDLLEAMRRVGADEFLARDAGGFDRNVGEHGVRLSGGQRAFLALARAFTSKARLLYLDEPTGAMDAESEKLFLERMSRSLSAEQTLIVATHRPALFSICKRLIVLDKGRIVADGPRDQILAGVGFGRGRGS
jgi:ATP-binding cassette subfamily C protein LapB